MKCLYTYHKKRVIVLLDEYETPLTNAVMKGYYDDMLSFMRGFMGNVFKTNDYLEFGVLTGVQRLSEDSFGSGFNNYLDCGFMDKDFATCFGFTEEEVKEACELYELGDKFDEVKKWYDGYRFGGRDMYNPWSIVSYLDEKEIDNYWVNTGSVRILQDMFYKGDSALKNGLAGLLTGAPVMMYLEDEITYPIKYVHSNKFWTMLLNTGYLKPCHGATTRAEKFGAELVNMEVKNIFSRYAEEWLEEQQPSISRIIVEFVEYLLKGDSEAVSAILNNDLLNNPSCHDFKAENSYHIFIYGILSAVSGKYTVYSNPESGKGRLVSGAEPWLVSGAEPWLVSGAEPWFDCLIKPIDKEQYAVVIEFKHSRGEPLRRSVSLRSLSEVEMSNLSPKFLIDEAQKGLKQIDEKAYISTSLNNRIQTLKKEGYQRIYKYSIAFHKKNCEVAMETVENF